MAVNNGNHFYQMYLPHLILRTTLIGKNLLSREQILSYMSSPLKVNESQESIVLLSPLKK